MSPDRINHSESEPAGIRPLLVSDEQEWRRLWTAYLDFYETSVSEAVYRTTFGRLLSDDPWMPSALVAESTMEKRTGHLIGLVHYLFHSHCWSVERVCYLQDLFVDPDVRGRGVGEHLIDAVATNAAASETSSVYWLTQTFNTTARKLYDRVATETPFIRYQL